MDVIKNNTFSSTLRELRYLKASIFAILAWPLICLGFGSLVWFFVVAHLNAERDNVERLAFQTAQSMAKSYADQLTRTVAQIDQHSISLAYYWKESGRTLQVEKQAKQGLYPEFATFSVGIIDKAGMVVTSLSKRARSVNVADRQYFQAHKNGLISGLHIEKVEQGRISAKPVIIFSRALKDDKGEFDGLVNVAVEPGFLASFYEGAVGRANDVFALLAKDGGFIASKLGANVRHYSYLPKQPMTFKRSEGVTRKAADYFKDDRARIVAWQALDNYNFVSVVAFAEDEVYEAFEELKQYYFGMAAVATILLALIGVMGSVFSGRLAWRKHQIEIVKSTYQLATEGAREGFFMARACYAKDQTISDYVLEECNERGAAMLNLSKEQAIGSRISKLYSGKTLGNLLSVFDKAMQTGYYEDEFLMGEDTNRVWMYRRLVRSDSGVAINLRDITESKKHEFDLKCLANTDALTKLHNRHWLKHYLPIVLDNAKENNAKVALLYLDLDNFKDVNNVMGHATGDEILRQSAQRMQAVVRPGDYIVRLGGDEFAVVLPQVETMTEASNVAKRIHEELAKPFSIDDAAEHSVFVSIGISVYPSDGTTIEMLLKHADTAMYAAKKNGKGKYEFYSSGLTSELVRRMGQEKALRQAVSTKQFILHYQPRVDAVTGELLSMEALVRWLHPEHGLVSPIDFIPLAEESGAIVDIGNMVIELACFQISAWQKEGLGRIPLSVNVSPRQFADGSLHQVIHKCITQYEMPPHLLEIEITESCMMGDSTAVANEIAFLKTLGIKVSVDDFGTGYSSLAQLLVLDLNIIKVDRAFTSQLITGKHGKDFFKTIISMARTLEMRVVAEGVETLEQLTVLRQLGCDEIQGYFISKPVPPSEAADLIRRHFLLPTAGREVLEV